MSRHDRPGNSTIEADLRAVCISVRALAPHLVQAPTLFRSFIAPFFHIFTGVIVRSSLAIIVNPFPVRPDRSSQRIQGGHGPEHEKMKDCAHKIDRVRRTAGDIHGLDSQGLADAYSTGRVRVSRLDIAVTGAPPDADCGRGLRGNFPGLLEAGFSLGPQREETAVHAQGDGSLDDTDEFAVEILQCLVQVLFSLVTGSRQERLVVFQ